MKKIVAVLGVLAVMCFGSIAFAAHEVGNVDQQPVVGGMVDVYGVAKLSVDSISTDAEGVGAESRLTRVSSNSSRLGFKGAEDVGSGLWAIYQLELGISMDANAAPSLRNTFAGLTSKKLGTLLFGIHDTPYKAATGRLDAFGDTMGDYNAIIGNVNGATNFELRSNNIIQYQSPAFSGFHVVAAVSTTGSETDPAGTASQASAYSAHAAYSSGPLYATVAYEIHKNGFATWDAATKMTGARIGAGYDIKATGTKIGFVFEMLDNDLPDSVFTRDAMYLSVSQKIGKQTLKLAYGSADDGESTDETGATFMAIGVDHPLSKRTTAYVLYAATDNDDNATYGVGQGGAGGAFTPAAGNSPSVISFGINHSF